MMQVGILMTLLAFSMVAGADPNTQAVEQAERNWAGATMRADAAALAKLLSDDLVYTHSSARTETKAENIEALRSGSIRYEAIEYDAIKVRVYGDAAVVTSNPKMRVASGGQSRSFQVRLMHVWVKRAGGWQLASHQTTRFPE